MWRKVSEAFGKIACEYDSWYEKNALFVSELKALKALGEVPTPSLEIGVGTGVFAKALGFTHGLDPSFSMLLLACQKHIFGVCGIGEEMPFKNTSFKACGLFFTLCFLSDPERVFEECQRVLKPEGLFFLGFIPKESPWGLHYQEKARRGHPLYRLARFREGQEVLNLLESKGFSILKAKSTLFQPPSGPFYEEEPQNGLSSKAGFWAVLAVRD